MLVRVGQGSHGLRALSASVDEFCSSHQVAAEVRHDLQVALDEIVNNVLRHAAPRHPSIEVRLAIHGAHVEAVVVDDGAPFDPQAAPAPDLTQPLETRRVGGLGIHLVRQLMDDVAYRPREGRNELTLRRRLDGSSARGPASAP
jgi:anti-sigma regulatory factor (Ser/Thr protein kinase)